MTGWHYQAPYNSFEDIEVLQKLLPFFDGFETIPFTLTEEHNIINAYWLSEFCRLINLPSPDQIEHETKKVKMSTKPFWLDGTEFIVAYDDKKVFVVARGEEPHDLVNNFDIRREPDIGVGTIHAGYKRNVDKVYTELADFVNSIREDKMVYYAGHSLGGGLATIVSGRLGGDALYTFGSPRVGDAKYALCMQLKIPHYRYMNAGDLAAALPPFFFGWRHFGDLKLITSDTFVSKSSKSSLVTDLLNNQSWAKLLMFVTYGKLIALDLVAEHNLLSYNNFLREQLKLPAHQIPAQYLEQAGQKEWKSNP